MPYPPWGTKVSRTESPYGHEPVHYYRPDERDQPARYRGVGEHLIPHTSCEVAVFQASSNGRAVHWLSGGNFCSGRMTPGARGCVPRGDHACGPFPTEDTDHTF
ncbi:hypothetical protein M8J76_008785 [Diaphorina citri]|nr:hypothetical protein M8J76_008785 [Diaphorina citri]